MFASKDCLCQTVLRQDKTQRHDHYRQCQVKAGRVKTSIGLSIYGDYKMPEYNPEDKGTT